MFLIFGTALIVQAEDTLSMNTSFRLGVKVVRHKITDSERGHRSPLSTDEPTEQYSIKVVRSTRQRLVGAGTRRVRELLDEFAKMDGEECQQQQ